MNYRKSIQDSFEEISGFVLGFGFIVRLVHLLMLIDFIEAFDVKEDLSYHTNARDAHETVESHLRIKLVSQFCNL